MAKSTTAREYLDILHKMPIPDRTEYSLVIPDLGEFEDLLLDHGCSLHEIAELITELKFYRDEEADDPAIPLTRALIDSLERPVESSSVDELVTIPENHKPRFPSGVAAIDFLTGGGGYGLTTVGGDAKVGKTMFAVGCAVAAAKANWRVVYVNAELDRNEAVIAVMRACGGRIDMRVRENMVLVSPDYTFTPVDAVNRVNQSVQFGDTRILVVLDSINALVDLSSDGPGPKLDYWAANSLWRNFAVRSTRKTLGSVAFLVVSETNKDGGIKGRSLEYKSDLVVRIQRDKEDDKMVSIDVTHSRSTPAGELGMFVRDWKHGRFESCTADAGGFGR